MKTTNLLDKDFKIVQKKKIFFMIPAAIVLVAIIMMVIYGFALGSPLNLGMDFTGGYTINIKIGTQLTAENYNEYADKITKTVENLTDENGVSYKLKLSNMQRQGSGEQASIYIKYKAVADEFTMEDVINVKLVETLQKDIFEDDKYAGEVSKGDTVSATISGELLRNALLAIFISVVLMLIYIAFRFELSSGVSAIIALFHDLVIMIAFMAILRIEINSTFIAALITILGYSINNTIIIFDRVRENHKSLYNTNMSNADIANKSIKETIVRTINTTITTLITIVLVALLGVTEIKIFAIPIIIGLLSGTYSSICISPSLWALWKDRKSRPNKKNVKDVKVDKATLINE